MVAKFSHHTSPSVTMIHSAVECSSASFTASALHHSSAGAHPRIGS
jgi:hypothetical protein